jgi:hypothetical protein
MNKEEEGKDHEQEHNQRENRAGQGKSRNRVIFIEDLAVRKGAD